MNTIHSAVRSAIYELGKTCELDMQLGEVTFKIRIELFRNTEKEGHFRCHVWELEMFRLNPTFPMDEQGEPADISDDMVMVDRGLDLTHGSLPRGDIEAPNIEAAFEIVLNDLKASLERSASGSDQPQDSDPMEKDPRNTK